jgi:hypothetical protein
MPRSESKMSEPSRRYRLHNYSYSEPIDRVSLSRSEEVLLPKKAGFGGLGHSIHVRGEDGAQRIFKIIGERDGCWVMMPASEVEF